MAFHQRVHGATRAVARGLHHQYAAFCLLAGLLSLLKSTVLPRSRLRLPFAALQYCQLIVECQSTVTGTPS